MEKYILINSPLDQFEVLSLDQLKLLSLIGENFEFLTIISVVVFVGITSTASAVKGSDFVTNFTLNDYLQAWGLNTIKDTKNLQVQAPANTETSLQVFSQDIVSYIEDEEILLEYTNVDLYNAPTFLSDYVNHYYINNDRMLDILNSSESMFLNEDSIYLNALENNMSMIELCQELGIRVSSIYQEAITFFRSNAIFNNPLEFQTSRIENILNQVLNMELSSYMELVQTLSITTLFGGALLTVDFLVRNYHIDFSPLEEALTEHDLDIYMVVREVNIDIFSLLTCPLIIYAASLLN